MVKILKQVLKTSHKIKPTFNEHYRKCYSMGEIITLRSNMEHDNITLRNITRKVRVY